MGAWVGGWVGEWVGGWVGGWVGSSKVTKILYNINVSREERDATGGTKGRGEEMR